MHYCLFYPEKMSCDHESTFKSRLVRLNRLRGVAACALEESYRKYNYGISYEVALEVFNAEMGPLDTDMKRCLRELVKRVCDKNKGIFKVDVLPRGGLNEIVRYCASWVRKVNESIVRFPCTTGSVYAVKPDGDSGLIFKFGKIPGAFVEDENIAIEDIDRVLVKSNTRGNLIFKCYSSSQQINYGKRTNPGQ